MPKYEKEFTGEISFPLGGIGTGCIGLSGNGRLSGWEIFNRPAKGSDNGYSHIGVRAVGEDGRVYAKVLQGDITKDFYGAYGHGYGSGPSNITLAGLPHFRNTEFIGEFPVATVIFTDDEFPGKVILTAFNPFIPLDADSSSLPMAYFMMSEGMYSEGLDIVRGVRGRYDGKKRNPYNEMECGNNYARSLASYALVPILSGFIFDIPDKTIGFNPKTGVLPFKSIWSTAVAWGQVVIENNDVTVSVQDGKITLCKIILPFIKEANSVIIDGKDVSFDFQSGEVRFDEADVENEIKINFKC